MFKHWFLCLTLALVLALPASQIQAQEGSDYVVGIDDILEISVLEPEEIIRQVRVAPDGSITFPYIGSIPVKGLSIPEVRAKIKEELADGYLKYPVVLVSLNESNSKQYMVYGEVNRPGAYPVEEYSTVLRAISMAGGFTRFGSSSRVKVLRPLKGSVGYETIKVDINKVMSGEPQSDVRIQPGDMIIVSEGVF